jgi:dolichol-phosphate mannosyltransferase
MSDRGAIKMTLPDLAELPEFIEVFSARASGSACVLIPVINEGERIIRQLCGMRENQLGVDVVLVDGGSTDGSMEPQRLRALGVNTLLVKTSHGKLSAQLRVGLAWALDRGYEKIVAIDGNGKDDFRAIPNFIEKLDQGFDFIQGSRYLPGGVAENTPLDREFGVRFVHAPVISLGAGFRYTDTTNGFRAYGRKLLLDPRLRPFRNVFSTYNLHYYIAVRAPRLGYRVCEIPVKRRYPANAKAPTKIAGWSGKLHILKQMFVAAFGGYNPR